MSIFTLPQFKVKSAKNRWKIVFAVLIVVVVGIYVLSRYAKKNSYPTKPTIDKVEFVYTQPTPLPTIIRKVIIGDKLDYQNLQTDKSSWKEFKKEVEGLLITFKYPKQYGIWRIGIDEKTTFDNGGLIEKTPDSSDTLVVFSRPISKEGSSYTYFQIDKNLSLFDEIRKSNYLSHEEGVNTLREIQTKNKTVVRIEYEGGWMPSPMYGEKGETYVVLDNGYIFTFEKYDLIPLEEFIAIIDSFKVEKCLKFCHNEPLGF